MNTWISTEERLPQLKDAQNRMRHVFWLVCDGYVCEPIKESIHWKPSKSCDAVAWMSIPEHPKYYPHVTSDSIL